MINLLKSTVYCFTIWVLSALVNAIISTCCLVITPNEFYNWYEVFMLSFFCTLLFSIPAIFIFWIIYITNNKADGNSIFRLLLRTGFITASISAILFFIFFNSEFKNCTLFLALSIIIAAVTSIMFHHSFIITSYKHKLHQ